MLPCGIEVGYAPTYLPDGSPAQVGTIGMLRLMNRSRRIDQTLVALTGTLSYDVPIITTIGLDVHAAIHVASWQKEVGEKDCETVKQLLCYIGYFAEMIGVPAPNDEELALIGALVMPHLPEKIRGRMAGYAYRYYHSDN